MIYDTENYMVSIFFYTNNIPTEVRIARFRDSKYFMNEIKIIDENDKIYHTLNNMDGDEEKMEKYIDEIYKKYMEV